MIGSVSAEGRYVRALFSAIAERYDLTNRVLSFGLDIFWRRRAARFVQGWNPGQILDLATGSGDLTLALRKACPAATFFALDFCLPMLFVAQRKGVQNLISGDALALPFASSTFDVVTVAFGLRNVRPWASALLEIRRILRPKGHLLILDFSRPPPLLNWLYQPYLRSVLPRIAALLTGHKAAYDYLGDSVQDFPEGAKMCLLLRQAGFAEVEHAPLSGGIASIYTGSAPDAVS